MANSITIVPFAVRIIDVTSGTPQPLDSLPGNTSILNLLNDYLLFRRQQHYTDDHAQRGLKILDIFAEDSSFIDGRIQSGSYGYDTEIEHVITGETFLRNKKHCEYLPFYFCLCSAPGQNEAILMLQRFGGFGVKGVFEADFASFVTNRLPKARLSINPIITEKYLAHIIGGGIKSLTCVKYVVPKDIAEDLGFEDHKERSGKLRLQVDASKGNYLPIPKWMRDFVSGWTEHGKIIEVNGIEYNDVVLNIATGKKIKSVKLSDYRKTRMYLDVTKDVTIGDDGHPTLRSMRECARELVSGIGKEIGWHYDFED